MSIFNLKRYFHMTSKGIVSFILSTHSEYLLSPNMRDIRNHSFTTCINRIKTLFFFFLLRIHLCVLSIESFVFLL